MNGGYFMIDCDGLNLLSQSSQTITGIYDRCAAAMASGKPVLAFNCTYGSGVKMSPVAVMGIYEDSTIIFTASILQIRVAENDAVTITSLLS